MPSNATARSGRIIRLAVILERTNLSRTTIWRKIRAGDFPTPIKLGPNSIGFDEDEYDEWFAALPRVTYAASPKEGTAA